ncbi:MAG: DoxX family protein [Bacteroidota bacterium]
MTFKIQTAVHWVLGLLMLVFGLNKFFGFLPVQLPADETAQQFLGTMFGSYLFVIVAITEVLGGVFLFALRTRKWGMFLLAPVIFNIVAFHLAHDFIGNGIWILPTLLFMVAMYNEWPYFSINLKNIQ